MKIDPQMRGTLSADWGYRKEVNVSYSNTPPGMLGELIEFLLAAAHRPVFEFALSAAIAFLAGIVGRAYNVSGIGLNQYIIVVADTGRGKEGIASGISRLIKVLMPTCPTILEFVGPVEIASPQALTKWLARSPSIYSIVGEFGLKLKEMSAERAPAHIAGLKRTLLDLYGKSGHGSVLGAMAYSKREDTAYRPGFVSRETARGPNSFAFRATI